MAIVVKNSPYILGIDLGTSNSAIAVYEKGEAKILPVNGDKTYPSVVNMRDNGEIIVGRQARNRLMIDPDNTVASIKREIGSAWTKEFTGAPGKTYTPTDLSAEILARLVSGAEGGGIVDLRGTPRFAVICIPANFDDAQKTATREAGTLAHLDVLELLEEPVAAAIAYAVDRERDQTILVYDLGGGTFDVSILQVKSAGGEPAKFDVLAKEGVRKLGGDDFDYALMELANAQFAGESGVDILDLKKDQGISAKSMREAQQKLKDATETAKRELTEAPSAQITIPNLIKDESGNVHNLDMEITRDGFNDAVRPLIEQSREAVERALSAAKLGIEDISRIILVGGSTRVPLVKQMLKDMFGKEPYSDTDPDTAVARGAAIYGATLGVPTDQLDDTEQVLPEDELPTSIEVNNIVTHFLGIETFGGKFSRLIEKGLDIPSDSPLSATKEFSTPRDNMSELAIHVFQADGAADFVSEDGVHAIGEFFLAGIPPKPRGQERVSVTFEIDRQNLLKVRVTGSSSEQELEIKRP